MRNYHFLILLVISGLGVSLQAQTPRAYEQAANAAFEVRDFYAAFKYYGKVLEMEPSRVDVMVRYADAARLYGAFKDAETHYETALNADAAAGDKYLSAIYGLAIVKKNLGKYDEALRLFERYASRPDSDPELAGKATAEIGECEWAMEKITNPDKLVELIPMSSSFNTGDSEMGAVQYGDTIFFSALHNFNWGDNHVPSRPLFQVMAAVEGGDALPAFFNSAKKHTALPAFSPDGNLMVVPVGNYISETEIRCALYFSAKINGVWGTPVLLPENINGKESTQTQPCITARKDGYFDLYFISDMAGGKGGKDIWKSMFSSAGVFAKSENLALVNTSADEATPFYEANSNTLYFSSTGYQNLGGYDIYKVKWRNNRWEQVKHLPSPINSSYNDLYYMPTGLESAFMTSNRIGAAAAGEESCCYDLFTVKYNHLQLDLTAFEEGTVQQLDRVVYSLLETDKTPKTKFIPGVDRADFAIVREQEYTVLASRDGYFPDTIQVSSLDLEPHLTSISEKLYLSPMKVDLAVKVFNQFSKEPLYGVNVYLYEESGKKHDERNTGAAANESGLKADYKSGYKIIAIKEGFAPDTVYVSAEEMSKPGTKVIKNLFLTPATLYGLLPLAIYFDNDVPPQIASSRIESYALTFEHYLQRKDEFLNNFTSAMATEEEKQMATQRLEKFFENEVKGGFQKLEYFADNLDLFLDNGYAIEIMVKGFASPLASDAYNLALTRRRIVSVKNYLRTAKNGIYESYLLSNQLKISTAPLGEQEAAPQVSDNRKQRAQSVFSPEASRERRAEIIEVRLTRINQ